jgi:GNAT superfamily N-acetyltransferase
VTDEWRIQAAGVKHGAGYAELQRTYFRWTLPDNLVPTRHAAIVSHLFGLAHAQKGVHMVAEHDGQVVGYASGQPYARSIDDPDAGYPYGEMGTLTQLAVMPAWRGKGIGAALVERVTARLARYGFSMVSAHITQELAPWYEARDWTSLRPGWGLAWIETHRQGSSDSLPEGAPNDLMTSHTPGYSLDPVGREGYDTLALRHLPNTTGPAGVLTVTSYPQTDTEESQRLSVGKALLRAVEADPRLFEVMPRESLMLMAMDGLSNAQRREFARTGKMPNLDL